MKHIVCLTKCYNYDDLAVWFKYHDKLGYRIHLIDNDSDEDSGSDSSQSSQSSDSGSSQSSESGQSGTDG